jgi:hypothetical protein
MTSGKIDDPWEASRRAWPAERDSEAADSALAVSGLLSPFLDVAARVRESFRATEGMRRIGYLFRAIDLKFEELDKTCESNEAELSSIKEKIASPEFREAVQMAAEEAVRAESVRKVDRFAAVLTGSVTPAEWADPKQDIATMIRDLAQLGDRDIEVLGILAAAHASAISHRPNLQNPDAFSRETPRLKTAIAESGIHPDDFLSTCERIRGFGFAAEVLRNNSHMGPQDFCYRPTRRGLALLDYLRNINRVTRK